MPFSASSSILAVKSPAAALTAASICSASFAAPENCLYASIANAKPLAKAANGPSIPKIEVIPIFPPDSIDPFN